jgi:hypothetical protein
MIGYRVTKYNPSLRLEDGSFTRDEWTSISDVGQHYPQGIFTFNEYLRTEETYVEVIRRFLESAKIDSLRVRGLEFKVNNESPPSTLVAEGATQLRLLREGINYSGVNLDWVVRLNLRELVWCLLEGDRGAYVHFGYDYYMYIGIEGANFALPPLPPRIYVEPFETPYR